ncbi:MAG: LysR family transcriptional regulator [Alphaproteobacteria bacterium]|nr:MAG: LysR family transcriptional regulator [Alphaproteobacteria bacterium]
MQHSQTHLRTRPISAGYMRAFEAVARHLNFRAASEEMALTQSAVSRQIQALEEEVGVALFLRHTRAVELTSAGAQLLLAVTSSLPRIDSAVRQIRQSAGRRSVALTTFASFASMWLIPRLEQFQRDHPDIDIRIDASDNTLDLEVSDVDLALRYGPMATMPPHAIRLFGEQLTPVASPWLLKGASLKKPADLSNFALIEAGDAHSTHLEWLTWRRWFDENGLRLPMVAEALSNGDLVEPLPAQRMDSPMAYWLVIGPRSGNRPEIKGFCDWLMAQSKLTRQSIGEVPDPDTVDMLD